MINIKIKAIMQMAQVLGKHELIISIFEGAHVSDVVTWMINEYGQPFKDIIIANSANNLNGYQWNIQFFLNGRNVVFLNGMDTVCHDGDELFFLLPVGGG